MFQTSSNSIPPAKSLNCVDVDVRRGTTPGGLPPGHGTLFGIAPLMDIYDLYMATNTLHHLSTRDGHRTQNIPKHPNTFQSEAIFRVVWRTSPNLSALQELQAIHVTSCLFHKLHDLDVQCSSCTYPLNTNETLQRHGSSITI